MTSRITNFIINGADYFSAHTDTGGVRIGNVGGFIIEFPRGSENSERAASLREESEVEAMVDEFAATHMHSGIRG